MLFAEMNQRAFAPKPEPKVQWKQLLSVIVAEAISRGYAPLDINDCKKSRATRELYWAEETRRNAWHALDQHKKDLAKLPKYRRVPIQDELLGKFEARFYEWTAKDWRDARDPLRPSTLDEVRFLPIGNAGVPLFARVEQFKNSGVACTELTEGYPLKPFSCILWGEVYHWLMTRQDVLWQRQRLTKPNEQKAWVL